MMREMREREEEEEIKVLEREMKDLMMEEKEG